MSTTTPDPTPSTQRASAPWLLVARRELLSKLTDKTFLVSTLVMVAMIGGYFGFLVWQSERTQEHTVAVLAVDRPMAQAVERAAGRQDDTEVTVRTVEDTAAAHDLLRAGEADAFLAREDGAGRWELTFESSASAELSALVSDTVAEQVLTEAAAARGTTVAELTRGSEVRTEFLRGDAEKAGVATAVGFVFAFLFYLASMMFGMQLASSVVEEKQNRIVEIIAAAIPLRQLLAGKVLGNTALALSQVLLYTAVALVGLAFTPYAKYLPTVSGPVGWFLAFFLAGFVALACLWAVCGSLVDRVEDLQATSTPLIMTLVVTFVAGLTAEGRVQEVLSFVPPFSPVVMPARVAQGGLDWWEPVLSIVLLLGFAAVTVLAGERIYRRALLQTGGRISWRAAWSRAE